MSDYQLTELQEKWLKALESGEYAQGKKKLKSDAGYCCLGVACVVAGRTFDSDDRCDGEENYLPESVRAAIGLVSSHGAGNSLVRIGLIGEYCSLPNANDDSATFAEIAAAIRANPENFFESKP